LIAKANLENRSGEDYWYSALMLAKFNPKIFAI
jgi:hypothetical protein